MAIPHEHPVSPTDPNRGLNVKVYLAIVFVAIVIIAAIFTVAIDHKVNKTPPSPTQTSTELTPLPGLHQKPSPLHPTVLQASAHTR